MRTDHQSTDWELIDRYGSLVEDPVEKLKFVQRCGRTLPTARWRRRAVTLESLWLASRRAAKELPARDAVLLWTFRHRQAMRRLSSAAVVCLLLLPLRGVSAAAKRRGPNLRPSPEAALSFDAAAGSSRVWLVETIGHTELYSNGLRVGNDLRSRPAGTVAPIERPVGIVFHTTESDLAPLEPDHREQLRRRGRDLLEYVRRHRLYHFVVDRFGRAWRIVPENEVAHHAGHSVWVFGDQVHVDLNGSFLGVALEAQSRPERTPPADLTAAQLHTGRLLLEMLRSRWGIAEGNCTSHDLVSVNPDRMLVGHHTDWAGGFPYREMGLANPYAQALGSIARFGFGYDEAFLEATGGRLEQAIRLAEAALEQQAGERGLSTRRHRRQLQEQYRRLKRSAAAARPEA